MAIPNFIQTSQIIAKVESLTRYFSITSCDMENHFLTTTSGIRITARIEDSSGPYISPSLLEIDIKNIKEREEWHRAFHAKKSVVGSFELFDKNSYYDEHFHLYLPIGSRKHFREILEYKSAYYVEAKITVIFSVIDTEEVPFGEGGTEFKRVPISGNKLGVVKFNIRSTSLSKGL